VSVAYKLGATKKSAASELEVKRSSVA
jgi:hypothetical protein